MSFHGGKQRQQACQHAYRQHCTHCHGRNALPPSKLTSSSSVPHTATDRVRQICGLRTLRPDIGTCGLRMFYRLDLWTEDTLELKRVDWECPRAYKSVDWECPREPAEYTALIFGSILKDHMNLLWPNPNPCKMPKKQSQ